MLEDLSLHESMDICSYRHSNSDFDHHFELPYLFNFTKVINLVAWFRFGMVILMKTFTVNSDQ